MQSMQSDNRSIRRREMACFPIYIDIKNKKCLVVGGGAVAARKVKQLIEFGADVTVVAENVCRQVRLLGEQQSVHVFVRSFEEKDVDGMCIVVAATDDIEVNRKVSSACNSRKIPVNVVDRKELCSFYFPAIIKDEELVVSVSTGGTSPLLASELKERLKDFLLGDREYNYGRAAVIMGKYREYIKDNVEDETLRRRIYEILLDKALKNDEVSQEDVDLLLKNIRK